MANYLESMTVTSNFEYGWANAISGLTTLVSKNASFYSRIGAVMSMTFGVVECIPIVGNTLAILEKKYRTNAFSKQIQLRHEFVAKEIHSPSFKMQELYFDIATDHYNTPELTEAFDGSSSDLQIASLIRFIDRYLETEKDLDIKVQNVFQGVRAQLRDALEIAVQISCCCSEFSTSCKRQFRSLAAKYILERMQVIPENESVLLPLGYAYRDEEGHSVAVAVRRHGQFLTMDLFNAGEGLEIHEKRNERILPIAFEQISPGNLSKIVDALVCGLQTGDEKPLEMKNICDQLTKYAICNKNPSEAIGYTRQYVGNCTRKSLRIWMHQQMKDFTKDYWLFRQFCTNIMVQHVHALVNTRVEAVPFVHPFRHFGSKTANAVFLQKLPVMIWGFFRGWKIHNSLSPKMVNVLLALGHKQHTRRFRHIEGSKEQTTSEATGPVQDWEVASLFLDLAYDQRALGQARLEIQDDFETVLTAVQRCVWAFQDASPRLRDKEGVALAAVQRNGNMLEFASPRLQGTESVVLEAIKTNASALMFASPALLQDRAFIKRVVQTNPYCLTFLAEDFRDDDSIVNEAVARYGMVLKHASPRLRDASATVIKAIMNDGLALEFASERCRKDPALYRLAIAQNPNARKFVIA